MSKRNTIEVRKDFSEYDVSGSLEKVVKFLTELCEGIDDAQISMSADYVDYSDYRDFVGYVIGTRPKTQEELDAEKAAAKALRQQKYQEAKARKEAREEQDRKEWERLSKKFGPKEQEA